MLKVQHAGLRSLLECNQFLNLILLQFLYVNGFSIRVVDDAFTQVIGKMDVMQN